MLRRAYKVKGEDVDDFMVMQDFAYQSYTSSIVDAFLFQKGYSKCKLTDQKIGLRKCCKELIHLKNLMFTQPFFLNLEYLDTIDNKQTMNFRSRFFNGKNELCAMVTLQLFLSNYIKKTIITPVEITTHF